MTLTRIAGLKYKGKKGKGKSASFMIRTFQKTYETHKKLPIDLLFDSYQSLQIKFTLSFQISRFIALRKKLMDSLRQKKKVDEISFILQNIFIIHPSAGSKYKIRVIINRNKREQAFKKLDNRYIFQLASDSKAQNNACFLSLLEKNTKRGPQSQYLQIGKGQVQLSQLAEQTKTGEGSMVNGVIYGTRAFNSNRIIGKYSYKLYKNQVNSEIKQPKSSNNDIVSFVGHKKKQKLPAFPFTQSIVDHSRQINQKLKQLQKSMQDIIGHPRDEDECQNIGDGNSLPIIREAAFEEHDYYYKYSNKIENDLKNAENFKEFKVMVIKNIRVQKEKEVNQHTITKARITKNVQIPKQRKTVEIMLIFYQLLEERKLRKRLLEIYLPITYEVDNRFLINNLFYLPKTKKKILLQFAFITTSYNKDRSLNGVIEPTRAKSKLVQLLDSSQQERGIFITQIEDCTEIDVEEIKAYQKQTEKFEKIMRKHQCEFSHFVKKPNPVSQIKQQEKIEAIPLDNSVKDTLYSNFHPKKSISPSKRQRYRTQVSKPLALQPLSPSISRSKYNFSVASDKGIKMSRGSSNLKSKRAFPSDSQTVVKFSKETSQKESFDDLNLRYRIYIESAQINLYGMNTKNQKVVLKFQMHSKPQTRQIIHSSQNIFYPLHLEYKRKKIDDSLSISLLVNKKNTTKFFNLGKCHILLSQFRGHPSQKFKAYITIRNKITAYVLLNFRLFRQKNLDEMTQSFYYKQQYDRERSLISENSKRFESSFDQFEETSFPPVQGRHTLDSNEEEFKMSVDSNKISNAKDTQVHYISDKMSDKAPSEVLQEEEYQNGGSVRKRY